MRITSQAFTDGGTIPDKYSKYGENRIPPIHFEEVPSKARSLALIVDDPDAPNGTFVHWVIWNLPTRLRSIPEGVPRDVLKLPDGSQQGKNDFGNVGWNGPCPPPGKPHHYRFRVFAVDGKLALPARSSAGDLERAVKGHITGEGTLVGTFQR